jgi:hypothetical protein
MMAPSNLTVLTATPYVVVLSWTYTGGSPDGFLVEWSRDGKTFRPADEVDADIQGGSSEQQTVFSYEDTLPTSGMSWYRVRAFRSSGKKLVQSVPSAAVEVNIQGPAAGDV